MMEITGTAKFIMDTLWTWDRKHPDKLWTLKEFKSKRSLSANAYFHRLVGLLADGERVKFYAKKNELIAQYGNHELERDESGKARYVFLEEGTDWQGDPVYHYVPTRFTDEFCGRRIRAYVLLKGTHTYTSAEMAKLIDSTRNECEGCGIPWEEIETFEERRLMERLYARANKENVHTDRREA